MESELRKKFVIVTVALLTLVLTVFYTATHYYYRYWFDQDTLSFVERIAESEYLRITASDKSGAFSSDEEDQAVIIEAIVTGDGTIVSSEQFGGKGGEIPDVTVKSIAFSQDGEYQSGDFIYTKKALPDGTFLIIAADTGDGGKPMRLITRVALIALGVAMMTFITFLLSRFVTEPAATAMAREKQFISDASHELKTPLGAISINAQVLSTRLSDSSSDDRKYIGNILREADRMNRLIERLLMLSKVEKTGTGTKKHISLSDCIEEMTLTYESVAYENGLNYDYDIESGIFINGSQDELEQLAAILIDNAIKHTDDHGSIVIVLKKSSGKAVLSVTNSGAGISPEELPHVFERFYKTDAARSSGSFGLGLAIAKAITDDHGAQIKVESKQNDHTRFEVIFTL